MSATNKYKREAPRHVVIPPEATDVASLIPKKIPVQFALKMESALSVCEEQLVNNMREQLVNNKFATSSPPSDIVFTYASGRITIKRRGFKSVQ